MADPKPRRLRRLLLRLALAGGAFALLLLAWLLFLPVPVGWAVNLAARRALPAGGPLQANVAAATLRWQFGAEELELVVDTPAATAAGRPFARADRVRVLLNKAALRSRHWLPSKIEVEQPLLSLDFKGPGWPHSLPASTGPAKKIDAAALAPFLPAPGVPFAFEVRGLAVELTFDRTVTWRFQPIATKLAREGDRLALDLALGLDSGAKPVTVTGRVEGALGTDGLPHALRFTAAVPAFRTEDLPPLPVDTAALPAAKLGFAFNVDGAVDLDRAAMTELRFRLLSENGELTLPAAKPGGPIVLHRFEAAGHASENAASITFDTLMLALDSVRLNANGATIAVGDLTGLSPTAVHAHITLAGPAGPDLVAWLPEAMRNTLPFPAAGLAEISLVSLDADLDATFTDDPIAGLRAKTLTLAGRLEAALKDQRLPVTFRATLPAPDRDIVARVEISELRPAALADLAMLQNFPSVRAFDVPVRAAAELTASPAGAWRAATVTLAGTAPGTVLAFGPLRRDLPVRAFAFEATTPDAGATLRVSRLQLDLGGPLVTFEELAALPSTGAGPWQASGKFTLENFSGEFLAGLLAPDALAPLAAHGVAPAELALDRFAATFTARAAPGARPEAATFKGELAARLQGQPLALGVDATFAGGSVTATLDLAPLNPARLRLTNLPNGVSLGKFDLPLRARVTARGRLAGEPAAFALLDIAAHAEGGPGTVRADKLFNADVAVTALALDATADGALQNFTLGPLVLDLGGVRVTASGVSFALAAPGSPSRATGTVSLENLTVARALQLWPADLQPDARKQAVAMLQDGTLTRAALTFAVPFDQKDPAAARPAELKGEIKFADLRAAPPQVPGPVTLRELAVAVDWPRATVTAAALAAPGVTVPAATVTISALDQKTPAAEAEATFTADFSTAPAWLKSLGVALPPDVPLDLARLTGRAEGRARAAAPLTLPPEKFNPASARAEVTATVSSLIVPLTLPGHELGGGSLALTASVTGGAATATIGWSDLRLAVPGALAGAADFSAQVSVTPAADEIAAKFSVDATRSRLLLAGDTALPPLAPFTAEVKIVGWEKQTRPRVTISATSANALGAPLAVTAAVTLSKDAAGARIERADVTDFRLGGTVLRATMESPAAGPLRLELTGDRADVPGLLALAAPFLPKLGPATGAQKSGDATPSSRLPVSSQRDGGVASPSSATAAAAATAKPAAPFADVQAKGSFAEVTLGPGLALHGLAFSGELRDGRPVAATFAGREGAGNTLTFSFTPTGDHHTVALNVADVPAWLRALTEPLRAAKLPPALAAPVAEVAKVPTILKGGRLELRGDVRLAEPERLFDGTFALRETTMIRPPVVLQLVAAKSRKTMQVDPLIREFSAKRVYFNATAAGLEGITLTASGLVDWLTLNSARYGLRDESVYFDGKYGLEFEVKGSRPTLGLKDVYLKENTLIRAIGTQSDLDFGGP
jgi:hypothetical protein